MEQVLYVGREGEADGAGAIGREGRKCKDRWGININTKWSVHFHPERDASFGRVDG